MTLTNAEIAAIRERAEAASPGPWFWNGYSIVDSPHFVDIEDAKADHDDSPTEYVCGVPASYGDTATGVHAADARFIAHSRTDIPALLDTIENLRAENARYRETLEYYANQQNWTDQGVCGRLDDDPDCGARAEFALAQRGKRLRGMG